MSLTIIVPSRNPETYFIGQINRLLVSGRDWKVIIIDDGSKTPIQDFFAEHSNLKILRNSSPKGAGASRNIGSKLLETEYALYLDDDDFMDWGVVDQLIKLLDAAPSADLAVSLYDVQQDGVRIGANPKDIHIISRILSGKTHSLVGIDGNETLLRFTNYPWNKIYRTDYIKRLGLRFSHTATQNDIYGHWQSLLGANRILVSKFIQCTKVQHSKGRRISNTGDKRRLEAFTALRETFELVEQHPSKCVKDTFWAFYYDVSHWMLRIASPNAYSSLLREHVKFIGMIKPGAACIEPNTGVQTWKLWDTPTMSKEPNSNPIQNNNQDIDTDLGYCLTEISRLKRLSIELRYDNEKQRSDNVKLRSDNEKLRTERDRILRLQDEYLRQLNSKAARWAFGIRAKFRKYVK
ncbi:glycosyltransferase [Ochrobactrum sp. EDr1-4]|uniref:glycosyltransferase n=1 Tax=Ochrobactrum sp. EDr1-4 TaxID=3368622 RepID=UPI003B9DD870